MKNNLEQRKLSELMETYEAAQYLLTNNHNKKKIY